MLWLINGLSKYKTYLIVGTAGLLLLAGGVGGGYLWGSRNEARIQIKEVEKRIYVPYQEIKEVQVRNVERERALQEQLRQTEAVVNQQRRVLNSLDVDSHLVNPVAVGVLNEAITGSPQTDPTGVTSDTTTTVTDLTDWALSATAQYNEVSVRYNALIDWAEEELIEPQRTGD